MLFYETGLKGAFRIEIEQWSDKRGFFSRSFCENEFRDHRLKTRIRQCDISFNLEKGTIRGMHYQNAPFEEAKLVSCPQGAVYDVILDLRSASPTYCKWYGTKLSDDNLNMLYVPEGFAHGFQTLKENSMVFYQMFEFFNPESAGGVRWDDPAFNITWLLPVGMIAERDASYPDFQR